jgi:2-polyprenyl-3-methyl-5-hydroxy-6-metoxy-1,4-benzoquinol methylase
VLDIGAGSGRDAFALADRGYQVTAVEPSQGMRTWAHAQAASSSVKWIDDALPDLLKVRAEHKRFEFVLCSAVLMHVPPKALARSFRAMAALAMPGGRIAASVRPPLATDPSEIFHAHTRNAVLRATRSAHLNLLDEGETGDKLGRDGVSWRWFVFQTPVPQGS